MMIGSNKSSILEILIKKLIFERCGISFNCGAAPGNSRCWCMDLPNMLSGFDLAGVCVCPNCLTQGKAKELIKVRKLKQRQRAALALRRQ